MSAVRNIIDRSVIGEFEGTFILSILAVPRYKSLPILTCSQEKNRDQQSDHGLN